MNIVVLVSGGGTNLQQLINAQKENRLGGGEITCVISSKPDVYALQRAKDNGIKGVVLERKKFSDIASYSLAMKNLLVEEKADLVVYAGFLTILDETVCNAFPNRMMNVHPALIPSFCGKGYYGLRVHEAVLQKGVKLIGIDAPTVENMELGDGKIHRMLLGAGIAILEGLCLESATKERYTLSALPLRLTGENGSPCRAVLIEE